MRRLRYPILLLITLILAGGIIASLINNQRSAEMAATRIQLSAWSLAQLEQARIPAGPVNSPRQTLEDETVKAANLIQWMDYPGAPKPVPIFATPVSLSRTPPEIRTRAPLTGEHTDEILAGLGLDAQTIADLRMREIV